MIIEGDFNSSTFRDNALEVGDTHMKAYKMMGAVAGFCLDMEGGEIELC